jgi:dTDP-4-dehydrorhamnose reductase
MKIAITGAGGLVGSCLTRQLAADHHVLPLKHADLDITNKTAVDEFAARERPGVIINCAVLNVDECETDKAKAAAINVTGPQYLAAAAQAIGAAIVHYSTNYVFDGKEEKLYTIHDEPRPVNNYGQTKLDGETAVIAACPRHYILRTSWVYGVGKANFLSVVPRNLQAGQRGKVVSDCWASATYVEDLAARTRDIIDRNRAGLYHVVNAGVCSYVEFTHEAGRLLGLSEAQVADLIELVRDADIQRPAVRPRYTPMRCLLSEELGLPPLRHWKEALAEYIANSSSSQPASI